MSDRPSRADLLKLGIAGAGLLVLALGLRTPVDGEHSWRQTHVAANIERFVSDGLSLRAATYNYDTPPLPFDFPVYQLLVAAVCRTLDSDPLVTARVINMGLYALTLLALDRFLAGTGIGATHSVLTFLVFASAPLNLFYFHAPIVDGLALSLSLLSLVGFATWEKGHGRGPFVLMILSGCLSTLIKNPVYLPVPIAIAFFTIRRKGLRGLWSPPLLVYFLAIVSSVILFEFYAKYGTGTFLTPEQKGEYFGEIHDRLRLKFWLPILVTVVSRAGGWLALILALVGVGIYGFMAKDLFAPLHLGVAIGSAVALLVFFDKYNAHSYYCLPLVLPIAFFSGYLTDLLVERLPTGRLLRYAALLLFAGGTLASSVRGLGAMEAPQTSEMAAAGEWIRQHTEKGDFVFYVMEAEQRNWLPAFLYFAKREGYNLPYPRVTRKDLSRLRAKLLLSGRRSLLFCPEPLLQPLGKRLPTLGLRLDGSPGIGALYLLEAPS